MTHADRLEVVLGLSNVSLQGLAPSRTFRYIETASVVGFVVLNAWLALEVARGLMNHGSSGWWFSGAAIAAYLFADLLAGLVHFVGDSFGAVDTPLVGLTFVLPFRSHHVHPGDICEHDFVATNGNNAFATILLLSPVISLCPVDAGGGWAVLGVFAWVLSLLLFSTNQIHKWAHVANPPRLVKRLQQMGALLSPERHAAHHRPPYVGGYCVTSGLCNRLLDPLGFFPWLERVIRAVLFLPKDNA